MVILTMADPPPMTLLVTVDEMDATDIWEKLSAAAAMFQSTSCKSSTSTCTGAAAPLKLVHSMHHYEAHASQ